MSPSLGALVMPGADPTLASSHKQHWKHQGGPPSPVFDEGDPGHSLDCRDVLDSECCPAQSRRSLGQRVSVVAEPYVLLVNAACAASLGAGLLLIAILGVLSPGTEITVQPTEPTQHSVRGHQ